MSKDVTERRLDIALTDHGTILEEIELIYVMTGFRRRFLVHRPWARGSFAPWSF